MRPQSKFLMLKCMVFRSLGGIFPNTTVGYPMIFDVEKGGAMMFREIRKEVIPPLDHVSLSSVCPSDQTTLDQTRTHPDQNQCWSEGC